MRKRDLGLKDEDAAAMEDDFEDWAKNAFEQAQREEALRLIEAIPTSPRLTPDETVRTKLVRTALVEFKGLDSFFLAPEIPAKKSQNARSHCQIPRGEELLAILDFTLFGSAKNCWAFTDVALYAHFSGHRAMLKYEDFPQRSFQPKEESVEVEARAADGRSTIMIPGSLGGQGVAILDAIRTAVSG